MNRYVLSLTCLAGLMPVFGQTIVISPGANVQAAVDSAAAGSTLALNRRHVCVIRNIED